MAKRILNTFGKLNTDTSINKYPKDAYTGAKNLRKISNNSLSSGAMENFPEPLEIASTNIVDDLSSGTPVSVTDSTILGSTLVRNTLVVFVLDNTNGHSLIFKLKEGDTDYTLVYSDKASSSKLSFNASNPIRAVGRYESEEVQKVYWCDGSNPNSFINIANTFTSGDEASLLRLTPNAELNSPVPQEVLSGGLLESGTIYYTYQLYRKYGNQTAMSSSSFGVPLSSRNGNDLNNFRGDEIGVNTGNSVYVKFDNLDTNFNRIKIYSIHFSDMNADPTISLISNQEYSESTLFFTDSGAISLESLTTDEFLIQGGRIFSSETLETKYNYLFAGNITEVSTDIDFDARVYRFNNSGVGYDVDINSTPTPISSTNWDNADEDADAVNNFNDFDEDIEYTSSTVNISNSNYRFKEDGVTVGGEGPNTSYTFVTQSIEGNSSSASKTANRYLRNILNKDDSFLNPILSGKYKGYKRNEVYRFGIEILFNNGQKSFVKWIGDIRFPTLDEEPLTSTYDLNQLGLRLSIDFNSLTSDELASMSGFKVVRAKRNFQDKNILGQGLSGPYYEGDGGTIGGEIGISGTFYSTTQRVGFGQEIGNTTDWYTPAGVGYPYVPINASPSTDVINLTFTNDTFEFISPEFIFNNNNINYNANDKLYSSFETVDHYSLPVLLGITPYASFREDNYIHNTNDVNLITSVNGLRNLNVNYSTATSALTSFASKSIYNRSSAYRSGTGNDVDSSRASHSILDVDPYSAYGFTGTGTLLTDYVRNKFNSQYGGNTYEARSITNYIPALCRIGTSVSDDVVEFIPKSELSSNAITVDVFGGDTYTCYFDYLRSYFQQDNRIVNGSAQNYITFPVETSYNLEYRRDEIIKYFTGYAEQSVSIDNYKMQEDKSQGIIFNPDNYPDELTDLYLYNDSYSRNNDITTNTQTPVDFEETTVFDTMVIGSNKKFNNELIDSWTQYDFNTFIEVDSKYGGVSCLKTYKDTLFYFQPNGVGRLAVEDRLQTATSSGLLSLGSGSVLERFDYISTEFGALRDEAVLASPNNLYYIDETDKSIRVISDSDLNGNLSKLKGISYLVNTLLPSTYISLGFDPRNKEILFSTDSNTLAYSELDQEFIGKYSYIADPDGTIGDNFHATRYEHIKDELYLIANGENSPYPLILNKVNGGVNPLGDYSEITLAIHPDGNDIFVFDNLDIRTNVFTDFTEDIPNNIDIVDDTIHEITYSNSYLTPLLINTNPGQANALINRLVRAWRTQVPFSNNGNRYVDTHLIVKLRFNHTDDRRLLLYDVISYIRKAKSNI